MPTTRNKDGELWDPVSGYVYNDDGTVLRDNAQREGGRRPATANPHTAKQAVSAEVDDHGAAIHPELHEEVDA